MDKRKKIMILGGSRYIVPLIKIAHKLGIHVTTVDLNGCNIKYFSGLFVLLKVSGYFLFYLNTSGSDI